MAPRGADSTDAYPPMLPGRPPAGPGFGPPKETNRRAVCCSGGGIRASAFCLGGMQRLGKRDVGHERSWYDDVDLVTAVSGGSYIAASFAMVNHHPPDAGFGTLPPYAPGSPEDNRLRAHTRYLVEDKQAAAAGVLGIVYGLVLNLLPILAGLFVVGTLLGWLTRSLHLLALNAAHTAWEPRRTQQVVLCAAGIAAAGLLVFTAERAFQVHDRLPMRRQRRLQRASLVLLASAAGLLVLLVAVPALLAALSVARSSGRIGSVSGSKLTTGVVGTATALVGLVKATLGRFRGKLQATTSPPTTNPVATVTNRVLRLLAPWLGSGLAAALLLVALVIWVNNAAYRGPTAGGVALCVAAAAGIGLWQLTTDINRSSIHPYYKSRLATAFAVRRTADGSSATQLPAAEPVPFSSYVGDRPALVVCAAVNTDQAGVTPAGRGCAPFTFSASAVGISSGTMFAGETAALDAAMSSPAPGRRMVPTAQYEAAAGRRVLDLPAAVAVSGAAVSPVMGRMTRAPLRLLLGLANVRLGLWLPNPLHLPDAGATRSLDDLSWRDRLINQLRQPGLKALLTEILGGIRLDGRWIYVTDGGHYENLGLVEALRRGATEIVVFDASGDPPDSWVTFGQAMQTARTDLGVEIALDPSTMRSPRDPAGLAPTLAVKGGFRYPNGVEGVVYLCKLAMPGEASWDVRAWQLTHPEFPHDSTAQQLYGDREFEAYRQLGEVAAGMALRLMRAGVDVTDVTDPQSVPDRRRPEPARATAAARAGSTRH